jgi:hypothetical protein
MTGREENGPRRRMFAAYGFVRRVGPVRRALPVIVCIRTCSHSNHPGGGMELAERCGCRLFIRAGQAVCRYSWRCHQANRLTLLLEHVQKQRRIIAAVSAKSQLRAHGHILAPHRPSARRTVAVVSRPFSTRLVPCVVLGAVCVSCAASAASRRIRTRRGYSADG